MRSIPAEKPVNYIRAHANCAAIYIILYNNILFN